MKLYEAATWLITACKAAAGSGSGAMNWQLGIRHANAMFVPSTRRKRSGVVDETCMKWHEEYLFGLADS